MSNQALMDPEFTLNEHTGRKKVIENKKRETEGDHIFHRLLDSM